MRRLIGSFTSLAAVLLLIGAALGYGGPLIYDLDALAHFRLHLLLVSAPVALLALVAGRAGALMATASAAMLAAAGLGPAWQEPPPPGPGVRITAMAANLYSRNPATEEALRVLVAVGADILVTSETTAALESGLLAALYPYRVAPRSGANPKTILWSKFPILDRRILQTGDQPPFGAVARIAIGPGREVTVVGLHFAHVLIDNQARQVEVMDEAVEGFPLPRIVMGDLNATAWSHGLARVGALTGTRRVGGTGPTWRGHYPTPLGRMREPIGLPIDHVLVSEAIGVAEIGTVAVPGSDHLAVRAVLTVPPSSVATGADLSSRD